MYRFEWNDTYSTSGWFADESLDEKTIQGSLMSSVGHFIKEDRGWYLIAAHKNTHPTFKMWGDVNWIPVGCVVKVTKISS